MLAEEAVTMSTKTCRLCAKLDEHSMCIEGEEKVSKILTPRMQTYLELEDIAKMAKCIRLCRECVSILKSFNEFYEKVRTAQVVWSAITTELANKDKITIPRPRRREAKLVPFLIRGLESGRFRGLEWENRDRGLFRLPWPRQGTNRWRPEDSLFKEWAVLKGRYSDKEDFVLWKTCIRTSLHKLPNIREVREFHNFMANPPYKVYCITDFEERYNMLTRQVCEDHNYTLDSYALALKREQNENYSDHTADMTDSEQPDTAGEKCESPRSAITQISLDNNDWCVEREEELWQWPADAIANFLKEMEGERDALLKGVGKICRPGFQFVKDVYKDALEKFGDSRSVPYPKIPVPTRTRLVDKENAPIQISETILSPPPPRQSRRLERKLKLIGSEEKLASVLSESEENPNTRLKTRKTRTPANQYLEIKKETDEELMPPPKPTTSGKGQKARKGSRDHSVEAPHTEVKKRIKEYEQKIKTPTAPLSPVKAVTRETVGKTTPPQFVTTLSPVVLSDKKLAASPKVNCNPLSISKIEKKVLRVRTSSKLSSSRSSKSSSRSSHLSNKSSRSSASSIRKSSIVINRSYSTMHVLYKNRRSSRLTQGGKIRVSVANLKVADDVVKSESGNLRSSSSHESDYDTEEEQDGDIPKTPTPPRNKKIQKILAKRKFGHTISTKLHRSRSAIKHARSASKKMTVNKLPSTPMSSSRSRLNTSARFVSPKILEAAIMTQKQEELLKKKEKQKIIQKSREERLKQKVEETRRIREQRMKQVMDKRNRQEEKRREEARARSASKDHVREKLRPTLNKASERLRQRAVDAEERRLKEEEARKVKLQQKEEEDRRYQKMLQKKKEAEYLKAQNRFAEEQRLKLEKQKIKEREERQRHELVKQRLQEEEARKKKNLETQKMKALQRQAIEHEKQLERERIAREKAEMERLKERERVAHENEAQKGNQLHINAAKSSDHKSGLNSTFHVPEKVSKPDCCNKSPETVNPNPLKDENNYDMTPDPIPLDDSNNYDITDIHSNDPTDDDSQPKKCVPVWAKGRPLKLAIIQQLNHPPNMEILFPRFRMPDLEMIFNRKKSRFLKRTSSANWSSPVLPHFIPSSPTPSENSS